MKRITLLALMSFVMLAEVSKTQNTFGFQAEEVITRLKHDINHLASEEMEGREAGTKGEKKAALFIREQMEQTGLSPLFGELWKQEFEFYGDYFYGDENFFVIDNESFAAHRDFFVLPNSASGRVIGEAVYVGFGMETEAHNDYHGLEGLEGKIFFMEYFLPEALDDGSTRLSLEVLQQKIETAIGKGAVAVVFVNTRSSRHDPSTSINQQLGRERIPVLFAQAEVFEYWQQAEGDKSLFISTDLQREVFTSYNVAGYWDNDADYTVVIGGHYDHLGYGGRSSRSPNVHAIHPGADDNASGVAGVLESARYLTQSELNAHNYIFIAFGAEEKGLLGSRHFTLSDAYDMEAVNYMFNLDMIGRMENQNITLYGTGTSPVWESTIDFLAQDRLNVRKGASGTGASDHTNFYLQNIPVLFFFTGLHNDYHRITDTPDKINFEGIYEILSFSYDMIEKLESMDKLAFTETATTRRGAVRRSNVALGLMPDHAYQDEGLRIQAVTEDNPAQNAGLQNGDVIIRIGDTRVTDIYTYMQALSGLQEGQQVKVVIVREDEEMEMTVNL